jgi:hypothetical protein
MKALVMHVAACVLMLVASLFSSIAAEVAGSADSSDPEQQEGDDGTTTCRSRLPRYTATQFINFNINTSGGLAAKGECEGLLVDGKTGLCYIGNQESVEEDLARRLRIIKIVLDRIAADVLSDHKFVDSRDDVLKIFMVPEFYFRGPFGAYSTSHILEDGIFERYADELREYISHDAFSDFLFVFGTVVAVEPRSVANKNDAAAAAAATAQQPRQGPGKENPLHALKAEELNYYNFSPVYKGGPPDPENLSARSYVVTKKHIAMDDFLDRNALPDPAEDTFGTYAKMDDRFRDLFRNRTEQIVEDNIIEVDGVRIGIEICLDHREGALWSSLKKRGEGLVDVQLVTSGGMTIERGLNAIAPGGVVYLSDGEASSAACRRSGADHHSHVPPDKLCRDVGISGIKQLVPHGGEGYSSFFPMSHCVSYPKPDLLEGYYSLHQLQGCANTLQTYGMHVLNDEDGRYIPSIEFYPTVALPQPGTKQQQHADETV